MEIGEIWAYRERAKQPGTPVLPVEIVKFGPPRAQKVQVRYQEGDLAGLTAWVPKLRLLALCDHASAWLEDERRFNAAREASAEAYDTLEYHAAQHVLDGPAVRRHRAELSR